MEAGAAPVPGIGEDGKAPPEVFLEARVPLGRTDVPEPQTAAVRKKEG